MKKYLPGKPNTLREMAEGVMLSWRALAAGIHKLLACGHIGGMLASIEQKSSGISISIFFLFWPLTVVVAVGVTRLKRMA